MAVVVSGQKGMKDPIGRMQPHEQIGTQVLPTAFVARRQTRDDGSPLDNLQFFITPSVGSFVRIKDLPESI